MANEEEKLLSQVLKLDCPPEDIIDIGIPGVDAEPDYYESDDLQVDLGPDANITDLGINNRTLIDSNLVMRTGRGGGPNYWYSRLAKVVLLQGSPPSGETGQYDPDELVQGDRPDPAGRGGLDDGGLLPGPDAGQPDSDTSGPLISAIQAGEAKDSVTKSTDETQAGSGDNFINSGDPNVEDIFRYKTRKCWYYKNNILYHASNDNISRIPSLQGTYATPPQDIKFIFSRLLSVSPDGRRKRQRIYFDFDPENYYAGGEIAEGRIKSYIRGDLDERLPPCIQFDVDFFDHTNNIEVPYRDDFVERFPNLSATVEPSIFYSKSLYNYYSRRYEQTSEQASISEQHLLSPYGILAAQEFVASGKDIPRDVYDFLTLGGEMETNFYFTIQPSSPTPVLGPGRVSQTRPPPGRFWSSEADGFESLIVRARPPRLKSLESIFDTFSTFASEGNFEPSIRNRLGRQNRNLIFDTTMGSILITSREGSPNNSLIYRFPFFNSFSFKMSKENQAAAVFSRNSQMHRAMKLCLAPEELEEFEHVPEERSFDLYDQITNFETGGQVDSLDTGKSSLRRDLKTWDLDGFLEYLRDADFSGLGGRYVSFRKARPNSNFNLDMISAYINEKAQAKLRYYHQMVRGDPAYSETLFYKIVKKRNDQVIQNIFLPVDSRDEVRNFVDSQVKLGVVYDYEVYAYQVVYGTKYRYDGNWFTVVRVEEEDKRWMFEVSLEPSVKILEVPFASFSNVIHDSAPLPPKVEIFSYFRHPNKISFFLTDGIGQELLEPITMSEEEETKINLIRQSQEKPDGPISYRSDDTARYFQIFRTTKKPTGGYRDFAGHLVSEIESIIISKGNSTSCSFKANSVTWSDETVKLDTKYYYMFRSVDIHGSFSNPSPIFETQLRSINNSFRLERRIYRPQVSKPGLKRPVNKFIRISPSPRFRTLTDESFSSLQNMPEEESMDIHSFSDAVQGLQIGIDNEPFWFTKNEEDQSLGRKFKVRITSKKTGNKVEILLYFKQEKNSGLNIEYCGENIRGAYDEYKRLQGIGEEKVGLRPISGFMED